MSKNVCDKYLDTTKDVVLQVDSSQVKLDAVLLQDGKLAKVRYANIERNSCNSVWVFEIPLLLIWQEV